MALLVAWGCLLAPSGCTDPDANSAVTPSAAMGPTRTATVVVVVDGDTLEVDLDGTVERVRILGIDTPETHTPGGAPECFGPEATDRMGELVPPGSEVSLETDAEERDRYGRLLAHVWRPDGVSVGAVMVEEGFAGLLVIEPNTAHAESMQAAAEQARRSGRGLWSACGGVHELRR